MRTPFDAELPNVTTTKCDVVTHMGVGHEPWGRIRLPAIPNLCIYSYII